MIKIYYKSDFDFILKVKDCHGTVLGWPDFDWTARLWTSQKVNAFVASNKGGKATNCFNDNGQIHIVADTGHGLSAGRLQVELTAELPNDIYPDGYERVVNAIALDIELTDSAVPCPDIAEVEMMLPMIKGEPGEPGEPGPKGDKGDNGADGKDGASAYEQAVQGGYKGTLAEFEQALAEVGDKQDKLADSEDVTVEGDKLTVTERAKRQLFIDVWNARGNYNSVPKGNGIYKDWLIVAKYDPENAPDAEHPFWINNLWLTYEEAIDVMNIAFPTSIDNSKYITAKTLFPYRGGVTVGLGGYSWYNTNVEALRIFSYSQLYYSGVDESTLINITATNQFAANCLSLREVIGNFDLSKDSAPIHFYGTGDWPELETIWLYKIVKSMNLGKCPKIRLECFQCMITNAANTSAITITVHKDVYAKLTDEWHSLVDLATEKNITFATA